MALVANNQEGNTMRYGENYEDAARLTLENNGGTFTFSGAQVLHRRGYYVGGLVPTAIVPVAGGVAFLAKSLARFARQHAAVLTTGQDVYLGTWVNEGNVYIDATEWAADRDRALELGRERGELAIWDCQYQEEVTL